MNMWEIPAIVMAVLIWLQAPPANLAEASQREALRRQMLPPSTVSLTNADVDRQAPRPLPTLPDVAKEATPAASEAAKKAEETHDEPWWHDRITAARAALERDQLLEEAMQSRVNALTNDWSARDDPAQRQQLFEQRVRVMAEQTAMKEQIVADQKAIDDIQDEARRQGVPAGWVR